MKQLSSIDGISGLLLRYAGLPAAAGLAAGSASALFLAGLHVVSSLQAQHDFLLWLLPFGGAFAALLYMKYGKEAGRGNNLVFEQIHQGKGIVPFPMAPLVLFGTLLTHLLGGSAGREGTAVQMGGSLSAAIGKRLRLSERDSRLLVLYGVCAGFGSVFGTPIAAAIFGLEVGAKRNMILRSLFSCLLASYIGHGVTLAWGIRHSHYSIGLVPELSGLILMKIAVAGVVFGLMALMFVKGLSVVKWGLGTLFSHPPVRGFVGGLLVVILVYAIGSRDYLGLGLPLMENAFAEPASPFAPFLKLLFTVVTLGAGFPGGEVTPLFVIGSTAGSALAPMLSLPASLLAALGFAAVFGAAAKTPLACMVLGTELFGMQSAPYVILACAVSFLLSGKAGIYASHVRSRSKSSARHPS
ncbi:chloride channel protein [Paenibacillus sp. CAU 1782]